MVYTRVPAAVSPSLQTWWRPKVARGMRTSLATSLVLLGVACQQDDDFCSTFHSLSQRMSLARRIDSGAVSTSCAIAVPEIVMDHELHVRAGTMFSVASAINSTLSGNRSSFRLFSVGNLSSLSLRGLSLAHAHCHYATHDCFGGAIFASYGSSLTLDRVRVLDNGAISGGGIYGLDSLVLATGCTFESNSASDHGGAINAVGSTIVATDCLFASNYAGLNLAHATNGLGGAIYIIHSSVTATACVFDSNSASHSGGAIRAVSSTIGVTLCDISSNAAEWFGGALFTTSDSNVTMCDCLMTLNTAMWGGAVVAAAQSTATATNCTVGSNFAKAGGGAFLSDGQSTLTATGCVLTTNIAHGLGDKDGGGAFLAQESSTVTMSHCTMISNSVYNLGGAVLSIDESVISASKCTMISNIAKVGGGAFSSVNYWSHGRPTVTITDCTMTSNSALSGGALSASAGVIMSATGCAMASNSAYGGGAAFTEESAVLTINDCTMTFNSARLSGGAIFSGGDSVVRTHDCTIVSNLANIGGGAVLAQDASTLTAEGCTFTANTALNGGALGTKEHPIVTMTDCTISSNFAHSGGAYYAQSASMTTFLKCEFVSNRASNEGGALYTSSSAWQLVGCQFYDNSALSGGAFVVGNGSHGHVRATRFEANHAQMFGGAVVVYRSGLMDLLDSVSFKFNLVNGTGSVGIVNRGGEIQCDANSCFEVCTACRPRVDDDALAPTTPQHATAKNESWFIVVVASFAVVCVAGVTGAVVCQKAVISWRQGSNAGSVEMCVAGQTPLLAHAEQQQPAVDRDFSEQQPSEDSMGGAQTETYPVELMSDGTERSVASILAVSHSSNSKSTASDSETGSTEMEILLRSSPAPIFVIDRSLRITSWSPGK